MRWVRYPRAKELIESVMPTDLGFDEILFDIILEYGTWLLTFPALCVCPHG